MANARLRKQATTPAKSSSLMVRLDKKSKAVLVRAAKLRQMSVSDYVRSVTVAQARREVEAAEEQTIRLSRSAQLAFWKALNKPTRLTPAQKRLGKMIREIL